jgi:hypothetical protein
VFFLPGHVFTALAIAAVFIESRWLVRPAAIVCSTILLAYSGYLAWDNWPSVNRHGDRRPDVLVARLAAGVNDGNAVLLSDLDWQAENALLYSARWERRQLAWRRASEVLLHLPFFVNDNHRIGRDIVLAGNAGARVTSAYGGLLPFVADDAPEGIADLAAAIPRGTPYVLVRLRPAPHERLDATDFNTALTTLAGPDVERREAHFAVWAGRAGERDAFHRDSNRPFRAAFSILGDAFSVRMESWLPFDTFRRAGFGHVLRGREPVLTIERGVSLVWFENDGAPSIAYTAGLYAPKARLRIPASVPQQVARTSGAILGSAPLDADRDIARGKPAR